MQYVMVVKLSIFTSYKLHNMYETADETLAVVIASEHIDAVLWKCGSEDLWTVIVHLLLEVRHAELAYSCYRV